MFAPSLQCSLLAVIPSMQCSRKVLMPRDKTRKEPTNSQGGDGQIRIWPSLITSRMKNNTKDINSRIEKLYNHFCWLNHHYSRGNIPIFRKSSHTMFSSYSRPGFWYVTLIGISAQSGGNSWPTANPLNAPPRLSIPYVVPKQLWTLNELKAALIRKFPHVSTEEGQGCQR